MKISVVMATYNGSSFLQTQLESLASQTLLPDELVVCDDNSTDTTVSILEDFQRQVSFEVRILQNPSNLGFAATFNQALSASTGDLVFLCDQDDFWFTEKIEKTKIQALANPEVFLWLNNAELVDGNLNPSGLSTLGQMESAGQNPLDLVLGCCMAVRRELLAICLPVPVGFPAHDVWLQEFAMYLESKSILQEVLQYYRRHEKNESAHIVYSLRKINQWDYRMDFYRKLFFSKKKECLADRISYFKMRSLGLEKAIAKSNGKSLEKLDKVKKELASQIELLEKRQAISKLGPANRLQKATDLLLSGAYKSGLKSYLRDILGYA